MIFFSLFCIFYINTATKIDYNKIIVTHGEKETSFIIIISADSIYSIQNKKLEKLECGTFTQNLDEYKKLLNFYIKKKDFNTVKEIDALGQKDIKTPDGIMQ